MTQKLEYHELSFLLPLMNEEDFDMLVEDIEAYGQIEPVTLFEGKILDGRNRYKACQKLGIEVKTKEWTPSKTSGLTPIQYVISENIMRRHLNSAQRAEIGLLLLPEVEKEAEERYKETVGRPKKSKILKSSISDEKLISRDIVGKKVKVSGGVIQKAKKIKKIAETNPKIAKEWEKAMEGESSVTAVYEKVKELEDERMRNENAKKFRAMQKQKQAMEKLKVQIRSIEKNVEGLKNAIKTVNARINVLSGEVSEKYPKLASEVPEKVLNNLDVYYDTLDIGTLDLEQSALRKKYNTMMEPLRKQLEAMENDYQEKKAVIDGKKAELNSEAVWVEKHQDLIMAEYEKIDLYKERITKNKTNLKNLKESYENEYKEV